MDLDPKDGPKEDVDLEDGEIESDGEDETPQQQNIPSDSKESRRRDDVKPSGDKKTDHHEEADGRDEWAVRVEKAIASVLKKDGIDVEASTEKSTKGSPGPSSSSVSHQKRPESGAPPAPRNGGGESKQTRRRKRKREAKEAKQRQQQFHKSNQPSQAPSSREDHTPDDYEMLCIRGGSPPAAGGREFDNESEHSYSSYSSYDSEEYRRQRKRPRDRRRGGGGSGGGGGGGPKHFDKRRHHDSDNESRQPRKMELCKFYLMDCCAKREKCLYMHSDFPCKYYYLGFTCVNREEGTCKFSHGRPLTNQLRGILLKHLETAPKEILGDFPRLGREHALNLLNVTHKKLIAESAEAEGGRVTSKPRRSRWAGDEKQQQQQQQSKQKQEKQETKEDALNLKHLTSVLSQDQISRMASMGIETLGQVQHLTFMQLTELGLTFQQLSELQLNTMNFVKLGLVKTQQADGEEGDTEIKEKQNVEDVDMRQIVFNHEEKQEKQQQHHEEPSHLYSSPDGGDCGGNQDEPKLLIDESGGSEEEHHSQKSPSPTKESPESFWPLKPPVVNSMDVTRVVGGSLAKIDYSSQILPQEDSMKSPEIGLTAEPSAPLKDPRDPRQMRIILPEIASPEPAAAAKPTRTSIYDQVNDIDDPPVVADQDLRVHLFGSTTSTTDHSSVDGSSRDIDLRLPFKPLMTNYVPATEIDASLASHPPMVYKVVEIDIPPPDYRELRRRMPSQSTTQDPRLRRILSLRDPDDEEVEKVSGESSSSSRVTSATSAPQDPRRKPDDSSKSSTAATGGVDIQLILQKSPWYRDLGSKNKIMVNQQLALLSTELKRFAADMSAGKVLDLTVVSSNPTLQHILMQLGVSVSDSGQISLMEDGGAGGPPLQQPPQARMMDWMGGPGPGPGMRPPFVPQMPPGRPGLLGVAPPMPSSFDFFPNSGPDFFNIPPPGGGDMPRPPRPNFRGRQDRWGGGGRQQRRNFDGRPRRDKNKN
ncbi:hypothetical protein DMENIID0001_059790 [Sergentomyia squamirostris]